MKKSMLRTAMLGSSEGKGMVIRDVLLGCKRGHLAFIKPALIVVDSPNAGVIKTALRMGFSKRDIAVIAREKFRTQEAFGGKILCECKKRRIDLITLFGFRPMIPSSVVDTYRSMIFGLYSAPYDEKYPGSLRMYALELQHAILHLVKSPDFRFRMTEVCFPRITKKINEGDILGVRKVEIWPGYTPRMVGVQAKPFVQSLAVEMLLRITQR